MLWIARQQNRDGGFGFGPAGGSSDVDDTGAVLQALAAGGRKDSKAARGAVSYLRHAQNPDGGFGQSKGASSNAQSTAWAVQGLVAVGRRPERAGTQRPQRRSPTSSRSRRRTGSVRYSRTSAQTPVWVTAQALVAFARKSLPLPPAKLKSHAHVAAAAPAPVKKKPVAKKKVAHARTKLHGGPIATIAQTTPAPTPAPVTPAAKVANPVKERGGDQGNGALVWALVGIGVAALVAGALPRPQVDAPSGPLAGVAWAGSARFTRDGRRGSNSQSPDAQGVRARAALTARRSTSCSSSRAGRPTTT